MAVRLLHELVRGVCESAYTELLFSYGCLEDVSMALGRLLMKKQGLVGKKLNLQDSNGNEILCWFGTVIHFSVNGIGHRFGSIDDGNYIITNKWRGEY